MGMSHLTVLFTRQTSEGKTSK